MTKEKAIKILKKGSKMSWDADEFNEAYEMAILSMEKLEQIEQIIDDCDLEAWEVLEKIKEVLEQE